jgi:transposase
VCIGSWHRFGKRLPLREEKPNDHRRFLSPRSSTFVREVPVWLFVRDPADLQEQEQIALTAIRQACPTADTVYTLAQQFMRMIRQLEGEHLDEWLGLVRASQIPELQSLVQSIQRDKAAVFAGLTLPHNNGVGDRKGQQIEARSRA